MLIIIICYFVLINSKSTAAFHSKGLSLYMRRQRHIFHRSTENAQDWTYNNFTATDWKDTFEVCGGSRQSPVNIDRQNTLKSNLLEPIHLIGYNTSLKVPFIRNTGHTVELTSKSKSHLPYIQGGGLEVPYVFKSVQFHWGIFDRTGSEHDLDGLKYNGEIHIFHENLKEASKGKFGLAVLAAVIQPVTEYNNSLFDPLSTLLEKVRAPGSEARLEEPFYLRALLPESRRHYYRYVGSLTTPPCTERVIWTVFHFPLLIAFPQMESLRSVHLGFQTNHSRSANFRALQPLNERIVLESEK